MQARIETLERQLDAVLRVLWAMHNENKGISNKIEKELRPFREIPIPVSFSESVVK